MIWFGVPPIHPGPKIFQSCSASYRNRALSCFLAYPEERHKGNPNGSRHSAISVTDEVIAHRRRRKDSSIEKLKAR
jgi:hypothetical protein